MARNQTPKSRRNDQCFENNRAGLVSRCFVKYFQDGHEGSCTQDIREIAHNGEEHGHAEEPTRYESNTHSPHDGNGHHFLGTMDFLGEVGGAVEARERPICIDEADDEGYAALLPARVVDEGCEDEFCVLVGGRDCGDGDEDDEEGEEGGPESDFGDEGEGFAVAVEEEAEDVGELVSEEDVPGFDGAVGMIRLSHSYCLCVNELMKRPSSYKSG